MLTIQSLHILLSITLLFPLFLTAFLCWVMSIIKVVLVLCLNSNSSPPSLNLSTSAPLSPHSFSHSNLNILRPLTFVKNRTSVRPSFYFIRLYHTWSSLCSNPSFTSIWTMETFCASNMHYQILHFKFYSHWNIWQTPTSSLPESYLKIVQMHRQHKDSSFFI
jgi:hypothetical protein